jgi:lipopolysaccharide/colanic/teichoic acid biosynthesis glycosyltransferase
MRRVTDVVTSAVALLLLSPVLLLIVLSIWCVSGAPVLFRQERWGLNGQVFVIWKFRTMRPPAHPHEPDSHRLLPLGNLLRTTSLDELPQLWNILRGDMSLIGPRPLPIQLGQDVEYSPRQWGRHAVRPGLTGWAQVNGRNSLTWSEKMEQDLWYIAHRSALLDLRIIALTFVQLIRPQGIEGYGAENPGFVPDPQAPATTDRDPVLLAPLTPETAPVPGEREHHTPQLDGARAFRTFLQPELPLAATTPASNQTMRSEP